MRFWGSSNALVRLLAAKRANSFRCNANCSLREQPGLALKTNWSAFRNTQTNSLRSQLRLGEEEDYGKTNNSWRRIARGNFARRQSTRRRSENYVGSEGAQRRSRQEIRQPDDHQRRCDRGERDRTQRSNGKHGRADGARGSVED